MDSKDDAVPVESISLQFGSLRFSYKPEKEHPKKGGEVEYSWDVSENAGKK